MKAQFVSENIRFERGRDPKSAMGLGEVKEIMDNTKKCYSRDRYGDKLWSEIIKWLLEGGYTPEEIELILDSKYMRWGMDHMNDKGTLEKFDDYFSDNEDGIQEMIEEEFGPAPQRYGIEENVVAGGTGGVSAPMSTLANTPGVGNVVPGAGEGGIGSGDRFDNSTAEKDKKKKKKRAPTPRRKKKRAKAVNEMNINPHDPVGVAMAKKLGAALPFEKGKGDQDVKQKRIDKDIDLDIDEEDVGDIYDWQKKFLNA